MSEWIYFTYDSHKYRTVDGLYIEWYNPTYGGWINNEINKDSDLVKDYYLNRPRTYEQLEMEANIKKLEWTIAEQQLEIERLRQKELELTKGNNNE